MTVHWPVRRAQCLVALVTLILLAPACGASSPVQAPDGSSQLSDAQPPDGPRDDAYLPRTVSVKTAQGTDGQATMERLVADDVIQSFEPYFTDADGEPSDDSILSRWYKATVETGQERSLVELLLDDPDIAVAELARLARAD